MYLILCNWVYQPPFEHNCNTVIFAINRFIPLSQTKTSTVWATFSTMIYINKSKFGKTQFLPNSVLTKLSQVKMAKKIFKYVPGRSSLSNMTGFLSVWLFKSRCLFEALQDNIQTLKVIYKLRHALQGHVFLKSVRQSSQRVTKIKYVTFLIELQYNSVIKITVITNQICWYFWSQIATLLYYINLHGYSEQILTVPLSSL